ncbi:MarR family winged helix-turn-helix transcriptional regulator [Paenibacillus aceris]|uniref:DNA-binding MarR family transcriptional regulator n=1 Tax=Paenibacillus aceris TaxID=869555 RepID=A0ABS4I5L3_9BACL|nr:MarR family transcriptional regulator [Paenibacillus aceris]MBP1966209.1 DNA-binding MarR family transcriptional regulator [Paenibacillus aceris]NHW33361.1 MarR family transcriptional regulator [Paenibacillus aceris]
MKLDSLEIIELEMAIFVRRLTSLSSDKKFGNIDRSAYLLLHQISTHGGAGVKTLADIFHLDISTVSRQAASLEQKEYVYRIPDPQDRRAYTFQITELGKQELDEYKRARSVRFKEVLKEWSDDECQTFAQLLRKFNLTINEIRVKEPNQ